MTLLVLSGIGCDSRVWRATDLEDHDVTLVDHRDVMDSGSEPETISELARSITNTLSTHTFDGIIAHSMGGLLAVVLLQKGWVEAGFLLAIETSFIPAEAPYLTLFHPDTDEGLQDEIKSMLKRRIPRYPDALRDSLRDGFDFESELASLSLPKILVYVQRRMEDGQTLKANLNLSEDTLEKVTLHFISGAAHFPPLEHSDALNDILKTLIPSGTDDR